MTTAVLTPTTAKPAAKVAGRVFRKQVLPIGGIDYKDATGATRRLDFTPDYLAKIVDSFNAGAYDAVKFQLADSSNTHTLDPERARGTVRALELTDDGLDMIVDLTDDGAKVIADNPDLPVSARIVEDLKRADGKAFPAAIQHVLGTLDPRVTGMKPWQAVDLTNDPDVPTVDLTAEDYTKEKSMPEKTSVWAKIGKALGLADDASDDDVRAKLVEEKVITDPPAASGDETLTAEEIAALEALANEPQTASLTAEQQQTIDLAAADAAEARREAAELRKQAAKSAWTAESQALLTAGVPKSLVDLAAPWCGGDAPAGFIDLANTDTTVEKVREAAASDMRKFLDAHKGLIDLSVIGESQNPDEAETKAVEEKLEAWEKAYPAKR